MKTERKLKSIIILGECDDNKLYNILCSANTFAYIMQAIEYESGVIKMHDTPITDLEQFISK
jgi:hypothetical protein